MIPLFSDLRQPAAWQSAMAASITDPAELLERLALPATLLPGARTAARQFPLRVPLPYLSRIEPGNPDDPLLRQILPLDRENHRASGFVVDPVGDLDAMQQPGLLHKYEGRVLLMTTGACAVNCRYCFRRHFPYGGGNSGRHARQAAVDYIRGDPGISEVILSGGDPLSLSDHTLAPLATQLAAIPHVQRLRLHTRTPVVLPERVDDTLCGWLQDCGLRTVIVLHSNHPREIDHEVAAACQRLRATGATLLNQSVLLAGVNDDADTLIELSQRLFASDVLPYYLHLLDPVDGAAHFDVPADTANALHGQIRARLPGYLVPRLVRETAGAASKLPVTAA